MHCNDVVNINLVYKHIGQAGATMCDLGRSNEIWWTVKREINIQEKGNIFHMKRKYGGHGKEK